MFRSCCVLSAVCRVLVMRYELWLGLRYLFAKRRERLISVSAALSISGVALGVAALLVVLAVMSGFDHDISDKLVGINAHLIVDTPRGVRDTTELLRSLSAMDHVEGVAPFVAGQAMLQVPGRPFGVLVRGLDLQRESHVSRLAQYMVLGAFPRSDEEVIIGTELSNFLGARLGDRLSLASPADGKSHELTVSGIFRSGMYETDAFLVGLTLERAQRLFKLDGVVSGVSVRLDQLEHAQVVQRAIQSQLGDRYNVRTWMELNPALFGALRVEKLVMFIIVALVIVVAALNIMSMLTMIVMEKTREIGILRALGATQGSVAGLFLWQGSVIGFFGISLGLAGGLALTLNLNALMKWIEATFGVSLFPSTVYYLDYIPTQINASDVTAVVTAAFVLAVLAGTYAAMRAARLVPVEALRYE